MNQPVVFITGISSGIGRATAELLAQRGYRVFGTVRGAANHLPEGVTAVRMDVREQASIDAAVGEVLSKAGRIDALINNAGTTVIGAIEETTPEQAQALFDTNFFGAARVTRTVLPAMRAQRAGRVLFVGSIVGLLPAPFMGFYSASKHALEGYAESLDHEVRSLGIRSILIEPGFTRTSIDSNGAPAADAIDDYDRVRSRAAQGINHSVQAGDDPALIAQTILEALRTPKPRLRYPVGKHVGTMATLRSLLPEGMFDRSLRKRYHLDA
jgi:NAD(P)-dependent dehydrogenase (short-subunit alcohol dehydrogenase family)